MVEVTDGGGITRREFLYPVWGASLALTTVETTDLLIWFALPRFRAGQFGGQFTVSVDAVPQINGPPHNFSEGRFWLVNLNTSSDRVRNGCIWPPTKKNLLWGWPLSTKSVLIWAAYTIGTQANERFECPCHGSKYRLDGRRIEDPAPRSCDRFLVSALDESETVLAAAEVGTDGWHLCTPAIAVWNCLIQVDTGALLKGPSKTLICELRSNWP